MRALLFTTLLALPACFHVDEPVCAYACGPTGDCPHDYECRSDNYCHKIGSVAACEFSDAAVMPDEAVPSDMSEPPGPDDLASMPDGPASDM